MAALLGYARVSTGEQEMTIRARHPRHCRSQPGPHQRKGQGNPDARAGWVLDLQIAACAWAAGRAVVTENRGDFDHIAVALADMYPDVPVLEVLDAPSA